jgi:hypothetical protein
MRYTVVLTCLALTSPRADDLAARKPFTPTADYEKRSIEGWSVYVNKDLLGARSALGTKALRLLEV